MKQNLSKFIILSLITIQLGCANSKWSAQGSTANTPAVDQTVVNNVCPVTFTKTGMCAKIDWQSMPVAQQASAFTLTFWNLKTSTQTHPLIDPPGNNIEVFIWMPDMGHGSAPVKIEKQAPGYYKISQIYFVMPGPWDIHIRLKKDSQVIEEVLSKIKIN